MLKLRHCIDWAKKYIKWVAIYGLNMTNIYKIIINLKNIIIYCLNQIHNIFNKLNRITLTKSVRINKVT